MLPRDAGLPDPVGQPHNLPRRASLPHPALRAMGGRLGGPGGVPGLQAGPPALSSTPDINQLLQGLARRWWIALLIALPLAGLVGYLAWTLMAPKYTAFTVLRVAATRPDPLSDKTDGRSEFNTYLRSQAAQMRSRWVLSAALNREEIKKLNLEQQYPDPLQMLEDESKVESQNDLELVRLLVNANTPEAAQALAQAITQTYLDEVVEKDRKQRADNVTTLDEIYTAQTNKLRTKKENLKRLADELGTLDSEAARLKQQNALATLTAAKTTHNNLRLQLLSAETRLAAHKAQKKLMVEAPVSESALAEAYDSDMTLKAHMARLRRAEDLFNEYRTHVRDPNNPVRLRAAEEVGSVKRKIETRKAEIRDGLRDKQKLKNANEHDQKTIQLQAEVTALKNQEEVLKTELVKLMTDVQKLGTSSTEKEMLEKEIEREEKIAADIGTRLETGRMSLRSGQRVTLYQNAALAPRDAKKQYLAAGVGPLAVIGLVCLGVGYLEFRRRRIQTPEEVTTGLGIQVVGAMPVTRNVQRILLGGEEEITTGQVLLESIDAIRTLLLHNANVEATRVLMVTSAEYGEGKTTVASHLASSLARAGRKTLLIDADLRQPVLQDLFEMALQPGLSEVLLGEIDTPDAVQPTTVDGLWLMTAGQWDREVIQCLARDGVQGIVEKLKEEFDFILFDSPPLLPGTDALLVGQHVDAVLLAVMRGVSQTPKVYAAAQRLHSLGIRVLGAVVNGMDPHQIYGNHAAYAAAA